MSMGSLDSDGDPVDQAARFRQRARHQPQVSKALEPPGSEDGSPVVRREVDPGSMPRQVFGYDAVRAPQRQIVEHLIAGGSALVLMPTSGGKSLCYQKIGRAHV